MADYKNLKEQLKDFSNFLEKSDPEQNEKPVRAKVNSFYAWLKNWMRLKDPRVTTSCLGPHAVLAARFYTSEGALEIHDHRGHLISIYGDMRLQIGGYAMDVDQKLRDELSRSGLLGEELVRRNILKRWVD